jgi:hypothetical protein
MDVAQRALGGGDNHRRDRRIRAFQRLKTEFGRRVGVRQQIDKLFRFGIVRLVFVVVRVGILRLRCFRSGRLDSLPQQRRQGLLHIGIVRHLRQTSGAETHKVVHQHQPVARGDGQHLVHAVRVERGEGDVRWFLAPQVQPDFAVLVPHDQIAPSDTDGSASTRVANMPAAFSVSRWGTKKLPLS